MGPVSFELRDSRDEALQQPDHVVADAIGTQTPFRTLEFGCNTHKDNKESIYFDNISWYGTGHVAPSLRDPRKMYRRLRPLYEDIRRITGYPKLEDAKEASRLDAQQYLEKRNVGSR